jgi:hypothetical protein
MSHLFGHTEPGTSDTATLVAVEASDAANDLSMYLRFAAATGMGGCGRCQPA